MSSNDVTVSLNGDADAVLHVDDDDEEEKDDVSKFLFVLLLSSTVQSLYLGHGREHSIIDEWHYIEIELQRILRQMCINCSFAFTFL